MDKPEPDTALLFSYYPFIPFRHNQIGLGEATNASDDLIKKLTEEAEAAGEHALAKACVWVITKEEKAEPVIVIDRAKELVDHIKGWSDNDVGSFFSVHIHWRNNGYCITLHPIISKSISRWNLAYELRNKAKTPAGMKFLVIYQAIRFVTNNSAMFSGVKDKLPDFVNLCFIDIKDVDLSKPDMGNPPDNAFIRLLPEGEVMPLHKPGSIENETILPFLNDFLDNCEKSVAQY